MGVDGHDGRHCVQGPIGRERGLQPRRMGIRDDEVRVPTRGVADA